MESKKELFERMPVPKAVMTLAIPTIISSLVMVIYNMADTYFVGLLGDPIQTASVTLSGPLLLAFNAVSNLFGVGSSSVMSRALGEKNYDMVKKASSIGVYASFASALLYSLLVLLMYQPILALIGADASTQAATKGYINYTVILGAVPSIVNVVFSYLVRAEGLAFHASVGTMSGAVLNIILDPIFIMPWGLNMGAAGAGLATMLSNVVACLYYIILIKKLKDKTFISTNIKDFSFDKKVWRRITGVGIPASIQNLLNVTGLTILNNFTAGYGPNAVAAMGIASKIQLVPLQISFGASQGVMPLVSYNYANGNTTRMKDTIKYITKNMLIFLTFVVAAGFIFPEQIISLFMTNKEVIHYGKYFLQSLLLVMPFLTVDFIAVGVFQAIGDGKKALVFAILRKIVFEIPLIYIMVHFFSIYAIGYAQVIAEIILATLAIFMLRKIMR